MVVDAQDLGDVTVVSPSADVVHHRVADLRQSLDECVDEARHVVLDLAAVRYLSAEAMAVLADELARLRQLGREMKLIVVSEHVRSLLDLIGLAGLAEICSDREAAIAGFGRGVGSVERSLLSRLDPGEARDGRVAAT